MFTTILFIVIALVVALLVCFTIYCLFVSSNPAKRLFASFKEFMDCDYENYHCVGGIS